MTWMRDSNGVWMRDTEIRFRALACGAITVSQFLNLDRVHVCAEHGRFYKHAADFFFFLDVRHDPTAPWAL